MLYNTYFELSKEINSAFLLSTFSVILLPIIFCFFVPVVTWMVVHPFFSYLTLTFSVFPNCKGEI